MSYHPSSDHFSDQPFINGLFSNIERNLALSESSVKITQSILNYRISMRILDIIETRAATLDPDNSQLFSILASLVNTNSMDTVIHDASFSESRLPLYRKPVTRPSGNAFSYGGNVCSNGGNTCSYGGNAYSNSGNSYSNGGNTYSNGGNTHSNGGNAYSNGGNTCSYGGNVCSYGGNACAAGNSYYTVVGMSDWERAKKLKGEC